MAENDREIKDNIVRTIARSKPRDIFGELRTEDFYISEKRTEKSEQAKEALNSILNEYGIIIERVSTRDYRFPPDYQAAIEEKKIADQQAQKFKSATSAQEEENLKLVEVTKGDIAKVKTFAFIR